MKETVFKLAMKKNSVHICIPGFYVRDTGPRQRTGREPGGEALPPEAHRN